LGRGVISKGGLSKSNSAAEVDPSLTFLSEKDKEEDGSIDVVLLGVLTLLEDTEFLLLVVVTG
jgi:hypothetical protein